MLYVNLNICMSRNKNLYIKIIMFDLYGVSI